jgi:hypothetical protein
MRCDNMRWRPALLMAELMSLIWASAFQHPSPAEKQEKHPELPSRRPPPLVNEIELIR